MVDIRYCGWFWPWVGAWGGFVGSSFWFCGLLLAALLFGCLCWLVWFRFCFCGFDLLPRNL